jgi:1,4-alpha-glucan branching enzyme
VQTAAGVHAPAGSAAAAVTHFAVQDAGAGRRMLRVRVSRAERVEVAGDFTNWTPVPLTPVGDGWWTTTLPIPSGTHQMNLRLDARTWTVPPGLTRVADEFGGAVGILTIP